VKRILVVDRSPLIRHAVRAGLGAVASTPVELVEAAGGPEAVACLRRFRFDLVCVDVDRTALRGQWLLPRLRATPNHDRTPVVALATRLNRALTAQLRAAGADLVLPKPLTGSHLREALLLAGFAAAR
jgi:CheY-like chemotaxis protein